jgi:magnesium-transporting ATPase (P-type)
MIFVIIIFISIVILINLNKIKNFATKNKNLILKIINFILTIFGILTVICLIKKLFKNNFLILADENNLKENNLNSNFTSLKIDEKFLQNNNKEEIPYTFEELLEKDDFLEKEIIKNDKFLSKNLTEQGKLMYKNAANPFLYCLQKKNLLEIMSKKDLFELYDRVESKCFIIQIQQDLIDRLINYRNKKKKN